MSNDTRADANGAGGKSRPRGAVGCLVRCLLIVLAALGAIDLSVRMVRARRAVAWKEHLICETEYPIRDGGPVTFSWRPGASEFALAAGRDAVLPAPVLLCEPRVEWYRDVSLWGELMGHGRHVGAGDLEVVDWLQSSDLEAMAFARSDRLVTVSFGSARLWDFARGELVAEHEWTHDRLSSDGKPPRRPCGATVSRDARLAAAWYAEQYVVWNPDDGQVVATESDAPEWIEDLALAPDASQLVYVTSHLLDVGRDYADWEVRRGWVIIKVLSAAAGEAGGRKSAVAEAHQVEFGATADELVTSGKRELTYWDAATGDRRESVGVGGGPIARLAVSGDGKLVATGDVQGTVRIYPHGSSHSLASFPWPRGQWEKGIRQLEFNPAGTHLAAADPTTVRVWRVPAGTGKS